MKDVLKTTGSFRSINVGVGDKDGVSHVAPPFGVVPDLMKDLFVWLKESDEHLLIKSCVFTMSLSLFTLLVMAMDG
jgi:Fic family protein